MCINQKIGDRKQKTVLCRVFGAVLKFSARGKDKTPSSVICRLPSERGISLIELIMFIVIVSVALAGIVLVMNQTTGNSANTLVRKQALTAAESLLEEIAAHPVSGVTTCAPTLPHSEVRNTNFFKVCDYDLYATSGIFYMNGASVVGLTKYKLSVAVSAVKLYAMPVGSAVQITVTVSSPLGQATNATGFRTAY